MSKVSLGIPSYIKIRNGEGRGLGSGHGRECLITVMRGYVVFGILKLVLWKSTLDYF